jgi:hypothetical protein
MKECKKCNVVKELFEFNKCTKNKDGLQYRCIECEKKNQKEWYLKNKKSHDEKNLKKYHSNKPYHLQYSANYREKNKEKISNYQKQLYLKNKEIKLKQSREWIKINFKNDPIFKLKCVTRTLIYKSFKRGLNGIHVKGKKTEQILGCTINEFIQHLPNQFTEGMTFENHGQGKGYWNIDHIIPISSAKTEEEIYKLNHYTNLQPLWWEENMAKGSKGLV